MATVSRSYIDDVHVLRVFVIRRQLMYKRGQWKIIINRIRTRVYANSNYYEIVNDLG